jgi:hypothetical protein
MRLPILIRNADTSVGNNPSKVPNAQIMTIKFDSLIYLAWFQSALFYICGKDKEEYILEDMTILNITDLKYRN